MARARGQSHVNFGAKVDPDLYQRFVDVLPIYGATTWFINESLKVFVEKLEGDPVLQQACLASVNVMLDLRREEQLDK